jgi:alpha-beta hydrolase superfamily lysophospholipase
MTKWRSWPRRLAIFTLLIVVVWLTLSFVVVYRLTRRIHPIFVEPLPSIAWGQIETLQLKSADHHTINGWFIAGKADQPLVLILHGHGACRSWMMNEAEMLGELGCGVLLISMRAHGDSSGDYCDIGFGARHDVAAAIHWLRTRCPDRKTIIWGQSMGAAAALFAAETLGTQIDGYILEAPFQDLKTAVWTRLNQRLPPIFSHVAYAGMVLAGQIVVPHLDEISPATAISKVPASIPILIVAGNHDPLATMPEAEAILQCSGSNCRLEAINSHAHIPALLADRKKCQDAVSGFIGRVAGKQNP